MALDTMIVGVAPGEHPAKVTEAVAKVMEADRIETIRNGPQWPDSSQLARWATLIKPTYKGTDNIKPKPMHPATIYAAFIHKKGQAYPVYQYARQTTTQIAFIGIQQYCRDRFALTSGAIECGGELLRLLERWPDPVKPSQVDICRDHLQPLPAYKNSRQYRTLCRQNKPKTMKGGGMYFKEKKGAYFALYVYPKHIKDRLTYPLIRVEVSTGSSYWNRHGYIEPGALLEFTADKVTSSAARWADSLI